MKRNIFAAATAMLLIALPGAGHAAGRVDGSEALAAPKDVAVPFELANDTIYIRMIVGAKPLWFILDTGCKYTIIDLETARGLKLPLGDAIAVSGGGAATVTGYLVKGETAVLPQAGESAFPLFLALPLDDIARGSGHEVAGVIGSDLFSRFVVQIDYKARRILLRDPARFHYRGKGARFPITFNAAGHPVIEAELVDGGKVMAGRFVFDIGSGATLILNRPFVAKGGFLAGSRPSVDWLAGKGIGGGVAGRVGRIGALRLGPFRLPEPVTIFSQAGSGAFAGSDEQGNIGAGLLDRFRIILDYPHQSIVLEPAAPLDRRFDYEKSGVMLTTPGAPYTLFRVEAVADASPGHAAGLRAGDRLVAVNGRAAERFTLSALRKLLQRERALHLTLDRDGRRFDTVLRPRPLI